MTRTSVPAERRRVVLVIDDAGSGDAVDGAVEACIAAGTVDGVSILGSAPGAAGACRVAASAGLSVGAHLNAVEEPLLTMHPVSFERAVSGGGGAREDIEREWRAQIELLVSAGAQISRLDSHRHIHHLPGLSGLIVKLAVEYGVPGVRAALVPDPFARPSGIFLRALARRLARLARHASLRVPDSMAGFGVSGRLNREYLERLRIPPGECELVAHPATRPVWSPGQPSELSLLTSDWFAEWKSAAC